MTYNVYGKWRYKYGLIKSLPCYETGWFNTTSSAPDPTDTRSATVKRVRDATGWRAPTPYSRTIYKGNGHQSGHLACAYGSVTTLKNPTWVCPEYTYTGDPWVSLLYSQQLPAFPPDLSSRAVNEALLKLKDRAPNLSEAFAERRETVRMITSHVKRYRRAVLWARRHRWRDVARVLRCKYKSITTADWASAWLQYRYGWMPLLMDSYNAISWLCDNDLNRPDRYNCHVIRNITSKNEGIYDGDFSLNTLYHKLGYRTVRKNEFRAKVRLDYKLANPVLATASQLGITNPLYLTWALTRLSFVVDWFLPIGDYLGALDASLGWNFRGGSRTLVSRSKVKLIFPTREEYYSMDPSSPRDGYHDIDLSFVEEPEAMVMDRNVYLTSPSPELPRLDPDFFGVKRLFDALSLLKQATR